MIECLIFAYFYDNLSIITYLFRFMAKTKAKISNYR